MLYYSRLFTAAIQNKEFSTYIYINTRDLQQFLKFWKKKAIPSRKVSLSQWSATLQYVLPEY